jgi:hypothetical protein
MKKNYVYMVAPIVALAVFTGFYFKYSSSYDDRMAEMHRKEVEATQKKLDEDAKNREIAAKAAFASQEKRKADKKAKDEKDARDKEMRDQAQQTMRKAQRDAQKLADRIKQLTKDSDAEKKEIAKIDEDRKALVAEQAFQRQYTKAAEANVQNLTATLDKVVEVDKQWEAAAKAAAAAASTKK